MTTIAVCRDWVASDSRLVVGDRVTSGPKFWKIGRKIFAGSGDSSVIQIVRAWIAHGSKINNRPTLKADDEFDGLVCDGPKLFYLESSLIPVEISAPFAIGSGSEYAMAYMAAGHNAKEAVRFVIEKQLDPNTGGAVRAARRAG